jgi:regulator of protease activity HflC (stomatin/prohibitin superfamily)
MKFITRDSSGDLTQGSIIRLVASGISAFIVLVLLFTATDVVGAGQRGVRVTLGSVNDIVLEPGFHVKLPFIQSIKKMDVQTQKFEVEAVSFSKDIQTTTALIVLNYHILPESVPILYQDIGMDYEARIIAPAIQESVKQATANFTAQELIEKRPALKDQIKVAISERLLRSHIVVDELSIANFDFTSEYEKAVEEKQVAEQKALQAENDLRRIEVEAKQKVESAKAEAESIRIRAEAINQNPRVVELEAINRWDGKLPQYMTGVTPFINLQK